MTGYSLLSVGAIEDPEDEAVMIEDKFSIVDVLVDDGELDDSVLEDWLLLDDVDDIVAAELALKALLKVDEVDALELWLLELCPLDVVGVGIAA